jgi:hypothetical protein
MADSGSISNLAAAGTADKSDDKETRRTFNYPLVKVFNL